MLKNLPIATRTLIIANVGIFILTMLLSSMEVVELDVIFGSYYPESINFQFWQPFTHMFIHAGIGHLLFNMIALFIFGSTVEYHLGTKRFLILYFIAGMGSFILFNAQSYFMIEPLKNAIEYVDLRSIVGFNAQLTPEIINENIQLDHFGRATVPSFFNTVPEITALVQAYITPMMGASGAIYGVLVAFGFLFPNTGLSLIFIPYPIKAKYFIPGLIGLEIVLGLLNLSWNPVAHFAHIGGAVAGFALVYYWKKRGAIY